jgi:hypothetical protein
MCWFLYAHHSCVFSGRRSVSSNELTDHHEVAQHIRIKVRRADLVSFAQLVTFEDLRAAGLKVAVGFNEQLHRVSSAAVPPYLQKMEYRDGGYAILRALWDLERQPGWQGYATIEEICAVGQKYCNVSLKNDHWSGNDHGYGWESNKSLCKYDLIKVEKSCQRVFPPEAAQQLLGMPSESWTTATVGKSLSGEEAIQALSLAPDELQGSVWQKGGAKPGRRFGAVKPMRLGTTPLHIQSLKLSYTVKSQRMAGTLVCINSSSGQHLPEDSSDDEFGLRGFLGFR